MNFGLKSAWNSITGNSTAINKSHLRTKKNLWGTKQGDISSAVKKLTDIGALKTKGNQISALDKEILENHYNTLANNIQSSLNELGCKIPNHERKQNHETFQSLMLSLGNGFLGKYEKFLRTAVDSKTNPEEINIVFNCLKEMEEVTGAISLLQDFNGTSLENESEKMAIKLDEDTTKFLDKESMKKSSKDKQVVEIDHDGKMSLIKDKNKMNSRSISKQESGIAAWRNYFGNYALYNLKQNEVPPERQRPKVKTWAERGSVVFHWGNKSKAIQKYKEYEYKYETTPQEENELNKILNHTLEDIPINETDSESVDSGNGVVESDTTTSSESTRSNASSTLSTVQWVRMIEKRSGIEDESRDQNMRVLLETEIDNLKNVSEGVTKKDIEANNKLIARLCIELALLERMPPTSAEELAANALNNLGLSQDDIDNEDLFKYPVVNEISEQAKSRVYTRDISEKLKGAKSSMFKKWVENTSVSKADLPPTLTRENDGSVETPSSGNETDNTTRAHWNFFKTNSVAPEPELKQEEVRNLLISKRKEFGSVSDLSEEDYGSDSDDNSIGSNASNLTADSGQATSFTDAGAGQATQNTSTDGNDPAASTVVGDDRTNSAAGGGGRLPTIFEEDEDSDTDDDSSDSNAAGGGGRLIDSTAGVGGPVNTSTADGNDPAASPTSTAGNNPATSKAITNIETWTNNLDKLAAELINDYTNTRDQIKTDLNYVDNSDKSGLINSFLDSMRKNDKFGGFVPSSLSTDTSIKKVLDTFENYHNQKSDDVPSKNRTQGASTNATLHTPLKTIIEENENDSDNSDSTTAGGGFEDGSISSNDPFASNANKTQVASTAGDTSTKYFEINSDNPTESINNSYKKLFDDFFDKKVTKDQLEKIHDEITNMADELVVALSEKLNIKVRNFKSTRAKLFEHIKTQHKRFINFRNELDNNLLKGVNNEKTKNNCLTLAKHHLKIEDVKKDIIFMLGLEKTTLLDNQTLKVIEDEDYKFKDPNKIISFHNFIKRNFTKDNNEFIHKQSGKAFSSADINQLKETLSTDEIPESFNISDIEFKVSSNSDGKQSIYMQHEPLSPDDPIHFEYWSQDKISKLANEPFGKERSAFNKFLNNCTPEYAENVLNNLNANNQIKELISDTKIKINPKEEIKKILFILTCERLLKDDLLTELAKELNTKNTNIRIEIKNALNDNKFATKFLNKMREKTSPFKDHVPSSLFSSAEDKVLAAITNYENSLPDDSFNPILNTNNNPVDGQVNSSTTVSMDPATSQTKPPKSILKTPNGEKNETKSVRFEDSEDASRQTPNAGNQGAQTAGGGPRSTTPTTPTTSTTVSMDPAGSKVAGGGGPVNTSTAGGGPVNTSTAGGGQVNSAAGGGGVTTKDFAYWNDKTKLAELADEIKTTAFGEERMKFNLFLEKCNDDQLDKIFNTFKTISNGINVILRDKIFKANLKIKEKVRTLLNIFTFQRLIFEAEDNLTLLANELKTKNTNIRTEIENALKTANDIGLTEQVSNFLEKMRKNENFSQYISNKYAPVSAYTKIRNAIENAYNDPAPSPAGGSSKIQPMNAFGGPLSNDEAQKIASQIGQNNVTKDHKINKFNSLTLEDAKQVLKYKKSPSDKAALTKTFGLKSIENESLDDWALRIKTQARFLQIMEQFKESKSLQRYYKFNVKQKKGLIRGTNVYFTKETIEAAAKSLTENPSEPYSATNTPTSNSPTHFNVTFSLNNNKIEVTLKEDTQKPQTENAPPSQTSKVTPGTDDDLNSGSSKEVLSSEKDKPARENISHSESIVVANDEDPFAPESVEEEAEEVDMKALFEEDSSNTDPIDKSKATEAQFEATKAQFETTRQPINPFKTIQTLIKDEMMMDKNKLIQAFNKLKQNNQKKLLKNIDSNFETYAENIVKEKIKNAVTYLKENTDNDQEKHMAYLKNLPQKELEEMKLGQGNKAQLALNLILSKAKAAGKKTAMAQKNQNSRLKVLQRNEQRNIQDRVDKIMDQIDQVKNKGPELQTLIKEVLGEDYKVTTVGDGKKPKVVIITKNAEKLGIEIKKDKEKNIFNLFIEKNKNQDGVKTKWDKNITINGQHSSYINPSDIHTAVRQFESGEYKEE